MQPMRRYEMEIAMQIKKENLAPGISMECQAEQEILLMMWNVDKLREQREARYRAIMQEMERQRAKDVKKILEQ